MSYLLIKYVHVTCVLLTFISFSVRGYMMAIDSPLLTHRIAKVLPHIVDSLLLITAIILSYQLQQYPFVHDWLTAKFTGLIAYILLGTIALKRGKTKSIRLCALLAAWFVLGYIISVALSKNAMGFFAW